MPTRRSATSLKHNATPPRLSPAEDGAVRAYAAANGRAWKSKLLAARSSGRLKSEAMWALVNRLGPSGVMRIRLAKAAPKANGARVSLLIVTPDEWTSLRAFAIGHGRTWRADLLRKRERGDLRDPNLVALVNRIGPSKLRSIAIPPSQIKSPGLRPSRRR